MLRGPFDSRTNIRKNSWTKRKCSFNPDSNE